MRLNRFFACTLVCLLTVFGSQCCWGQDADKDQAICNTTWDDTYFYVAFKVDCPDVRGKQSSPNVDLSGDDYVSVFIETDNKRSTQATPQCFSMAVSAAGGSQFRAGTDNGVMEPLTVWKFKYGVTVQGTLNNSDDVDMGYSVELAIPWELMKMQPPKLGDAVSFNLIIRRHGATGGSFISLSPHVITENDVTNPSKWMNMLFVAYSFGARMPGDKMLSTKSIVRPPLINGQIQDREWAKNGAFAIDLPMEPGIVYEAKFPVRKLVFTRYLYSYQRDHRRAAPYSELAAGDGGLALQSFPSMNLGPWFSSDRVQWHKEELSDIALSGIDVVLPAYRGDKASRAAFADKGLDCMVSALQELRTEGKPFPLVAMVFESSALLAAYGGQEPDLGSDEVKRTVYGMIKSFYDRVPREFRAWTQTGKPDAGQIADIVFLSDSEALSQFDPGVLAYVRDRFLRDFGRPLVWIVPDRLKGKTPDCDGFWELGAGLGLKYAGDGRIRTATVAPGFSSASEMRPRMAGKAYEDDWSDAIAKDPHWVICDTWNGFEEGTEICATREYGRKYIDVTRANVLRFRGSKEFDVQYLSCEIPMVVAPKQFAKAELTIRNAGSSPWRVAEGFAVSYRWYKSGRFLGESKVRRPLDRDVGPGETITVQVGIATVNAQGDALPDGNCEARIDIMRLSDGKWLSALGAQSLIVPITVGRTPEWKATYLACGAPAMLESSRNYGVKLRVRNDGSQTWAKGQVKLSCRLYKVREYTHDDSGELMEEVPIKSIRVLLDKDCKPGDIAEFAFPLNLALAGGKPVPAWSPDLPWSYQIRFDLYNGSNWLSEVGSPTLSRSVAIFESDYGARIVDSSVPAKVTAGQSMDAKVVMRNNGVRTWDRKRASVGCHWYHLDGLEMVWDGPTTPLAANLQPGWPVVANAKLKAPEYDGQYVLVWDVFIDGQWTSTLPLARGGDILPVTVEVSGGRLAFVDLSALCDTVLASPDTNRTAGDFDGRGGSFPAEQIPPDASPSGVISRVYPSGYKWDRENRPDGRISFLYPEKTPESKGAVALNGQKLTIEHGRYVAMHILGAASSPDASGAFSLNYETGARTVELTMSDWGEGPKHGEKVGCAVRHRHTHGGDDLSKRCYLYHYTVPLDRSRVLESITFPRNPAMKVVAVTLERASLPPASEVVPVSGSAERKE
jgi:hypothetical protein